MTMKSIKAVVALVAISSTLANFHVASAQNIGARSVKRVVGETITLPANTPITVSMNEDVNSKSVQVGSPFSLSVVTDVKSDGFVVIPRGSRANGQVTWKTGKGAFGKSGKMEVEISSVDVEGGRINTVGKFRQEGEGNTVATVGAVVVAGVFAAFVTGKSALIPRGRELTIHTKEPVTVSLAD